MFQIVKSIDITDFALHQINYNDYLNHIQRIKPFCAVFFAGYFNTTSAVDAIQFKMNSNNIDSGTIKLYGVS